VNFTAWHGVSDTVDHLMAILCANGDGRARYDRFQIELSREAMTSTIRARRTSGD
jgi:hypothetical protein